MRFHNQMIVIIHQTIGMTEYVISLVYFMEYVQKQNAVRTVR